MTMPLKLIVNEAKIDKLVGIIHYGDVADAEADDYGFNGVKKVIWIHPNPQKNMMLYAKVVAKSYRNHFSSTQLINEDTAYGKRFDSYVRENIAYLNLDQFNILKVNPMAGIPIDSMKFLEGTGKLLEQHNSIQAVLLPSDNKEIESYMNQKGFKRALITENSILYTRPKQ